MKYINRFSTNADYQAFTEGGGYVTPNICYVEENESLVFKPEINNGGGTNDLFPITLIKGDNGQYGINVFNYLYDIVQTRGEYNSCHLLENEYITVGEYTFTSVYCPVETAIALNPIPSGYLTVVLTNDGGLYMSLD